MFSFCCAFSRQLLSILSIVDIVFSVVFVLVTGIYAVSCRVEDVQVISYDATLEQMQFFYDALRYCGFSEEKDVPKSSTTCSQLGRMVIPFVLVFLILNFLLGIYIQIIISNNKFLNKGRKRSIKSISYVIIPIGTLTAMCVSAIGLHEFNKPKYCWLNYSVANERNFATQLKMTILTSFILCVYKPIELGVLYFYVGQLLTNLKEEGVRAQPSTAQPNNPPQSLMNPGNNVIRPQPYSLHPSRHGPHFVTVVQ